MHTSSLSVPSGIANVPPVILSTSSPESASHRVPEQVFEGHESQVKCVCFHPDEKKLVSGSDDGTLRIWDRTTGSVEVLSGHTDWVCDVDVSRDGELVVSGSDDTTVRMWNRELGETVHVFEGHENYVISVQFSADSRRVVSGSGDETARVWSVETGKLAFEPIKCHGRVYCVSYSPSGDRIASGADSVQIWNAETGSGLLSIRNSKVVSLAWTADGTYIIGGGRGEVTIWNSHNGQQLRTWQAHNNVATIKLSLSPSGSHLATRGWNDKTAFVFDVSTGERVATLQHDEDVYGIVYSPSGQFIGTGCDDGRVYLWEAPVIENPSAKLPASSFLSLLDRPAILLVRPPPNDGTGVNLFPKNPQTATYRDQQGSSLPRQILNKVGVTFSNLFTGRTAHAAQNSPLAEALELVDVAAGIDRPYAATIDPPRFNRVQKILYTIIHCRRPDEEDEEVPAANSDTRLDPSQPPAGKTVIDTQPQSNEMIARGPFSTPSVIPATSKVSTHAVSQPTLSSDPLFLAVASREPSSSVVAVMPAPLSAPSNSSRPPSAHSSSHDVDDLVTVTVSREEWANLQDVRRRKITSAVIVKPADPLSRPEHDHEPSVCPYPSTSLPRSLAYVMRNTSPIRRPLSPQPGCHHYAQPSRSLLGLGTLFDVVPSSLSQSPLSAPLGHSQLFHHPMSNVQLPRLHLMASTDNLLVEAPSESPAQLAMGRPASDEEVD